MVPQAVHEVSAYIGVLRTSVVLASDDRLYIVKSVAAAGERRWLAAEYLAAEFARAAGLPVPEVPPIIVPAATLPAHSRGYAGLQLASGFVASPPSGAVYNLLPTSMLPEVANREAFIGMFVFDAWTRKVGKRQAIFARKSPERPYEVFFVGNRDAFNAARWGLDRGAADISYPQTEAYQTTGSKAVLRWLETIRRLRGKRLLAIAETMPPEWSFAGHRRLVERLLERKYELVDIVREHAAAAQPELSRLF